MTRLRRTAVGLLLAVLALSFVPAAEATGGRGAPVDHAPAARPAPTASGTPSVSTAARARIGGRWPGRRITYSDSLPPSYDWVISRAVRAWNKGSGAKIKFVRAAKGKRGQVRISRAPTPGVGGQATLGYQPKAWVHLSNNLPKRLDRSDWVRTSVLLAHELGHVLGLGHSPRTGDLMYQYIPEEGDLGDGTMTCRWVTRNDARRAVRLYGGKVALAPQLCLVQPLAPALTSVVATGGNAETKPVHLDWTLPAGLSADSHIYVEIFAGGTCGSKPTGAFVASFELARTATSWVDPDASRWESVYCYHLEALNYWGGGSGAFVTTR